VEEFFAVQGFFTVRTDDILAVKKPISAGTPPPDKFVLDYHDVALLHNAIVKPVGWHTLKFVPSVLKKSPEIFDFVGPSFQRKAQAFFGEEAYRRVLVVPGLPVSEELKKESIAFMKEKGVDHVVGFPAVIAGLLEKINPRQVYLSETSEILRSLKLYKFFPEQEPTLPF